MHRNFTASLKPNEYRILLASVLQKTTDWVFLHQKSIELSVEQQKKLNDYVKRREKGEPIAKIIGLKEFYSRNFYTNKYTLDPRPDSETIIDAVKLFYNSTDKLKILDLGVGTGCLLFTLLLEFPYSFGIGVDKSFDALKVTLKNQHEFNLVDRSFLINGNWSEALSCDFDVLVANPPYISRGEVLDEETLHDPHEALFADENGFKDYRIILYEVSKLMKNDSLLFLEMGKGQLETIKHLTFQNNLNVEKVFQDLSGIERVLCCRKIS